MGAAAPVEQPRASPEPPAGAAGTGGAQGRTQDTRRSQTHADASDAAHKKRSGRSTRARSPGPEGQKKAAKGRLRPRAGAKPPPKPRSGLGREEAATPAKSLADGQRLQGQPNRAPAGSRRTAAGTAGALPTTERDSAHTGGSFGAAAGGLAGRARGAKRGRIRRTAPAKRRRVRRAGADAAR